MGSTALTSFGNRSNIHFIALEADAHRCCSIAVQITRKVTEFSFKEKGGRTSDKAMTQSTAHNSLIDSHADVWTRFPVVPAVPRATKTFNSNRLPRALLFVAQQRREAFRPHLKSLISSFEKRTKKPTEGELENIVIEAFQFDDFVSLPASSWSTFCMGEWLVDILCLIPIHIAVARDNRFVPLKDGVWSADFERSLVGATVDQIVDNISFGWYESILRSYMATKVAYFGASIYDPETHTHGHLTARESRIFYG